MHITAVVLLVIIWVVILVSYCRLRHTLKTLFNDAYVTHRKMLLYFVVGVEVSATIASALLVFPFFVNNFAHGVLQTIS
jgi:hypothetical protein